MLPWKRAIEKEPSNKLKVLINVKGVYHIAVYHADKKIFRVSEKSRNLDLKVEEHDIFWI